VVLHGRLARALLAFGLGYICIMVTCASGPLGGPATVTAARPVRAHHHEHAGVQADDAGPAVGGVPTPPVRVLLTLVLGLLLAAIAAWVPLGAPRRHWHAFARPRRGPPPLLAH
jgi:hypothetical protein